jgi:hypothetical protein
MSTQNTGAAASAQHTPGPWIAHGMTIYGPQSLARAKSFYRPEPHSTPIARMITSADGEKYADDGELFASDAEALANAEHIVRAVNSHADLLSALERAEVYLSLLADKADGPNVIHRDLALTRVAIARAKGGAA